MQSGPKIDPLDASNALSKIRGGFNYDLCLRNEMLSQSGMKPPGAFKTGTTIVGMVFKDGIVLGADTRATGGSIVCDKNCEKIHRIADNIWCCGAGTAADTEQVTAMISSDLELHALNTSTQPRVVSALTRLKQHLFQYQGHVSAALVLGGVDATGAHLYTVYPHGSTDKLPFVTMGSGSLAAMAVFEKGYKDGLDEEEAVQLVHDAVASGIFNDLGSGSNVDIMVINKEGFKSMRNYSTPNERIYPRRMIEFPRGSTAWLEETKTIFKNKIEVSEEVKMEV